MHENGLRILTVLLIHREQKKRQHDSDHHERRDGDPCVLFGKKEERQSDKDRRPEAEELPLCEVQKDLAFDPRQIPRDRGIKVIQRNSFPAAERGLIRLMAVENGFA